MIFSILLAALAVAAPSAAVKREPFAFRDWRAGDAFRSDDRRFRQCVVIPSGHACAFADSRIGGVEAQQLGATFGPQGLYSLAAKFSAKSATIVEAALRERYGKPCIERIDHPHNRMGERFDNRVIVWCFHDGSGTFQSIDGNIEDASFVFEVPDAAKQAAVQDF